MSTGIKQKNLLIIYQSFAMSWYKLSANMFTYLIKTSMLT
ncbi:UNVERIFIED_CONTAM: hypothetical protein GTU68_019534 [Idotea baltica]|nr:hypothetical protein [Idotea baltica]